MTCYFLSKGSTFTLVVMKVFDICSGDNCCDMKRFNAHGAWIFIMKWLRTATKHLTLVLLCLKMSMDGSRLLLKSQWLQFCWVGGGRLAGKRCGKRVWGKTKDKVGQLYRRTTFPHLAHLRQQSFFTFCSDAIESITPSLTVDSLTEPNIRKYTWPKAFAPVKTLSCCQLKKVAFPQIPRF